MKKIVTLLVLTTIVSVLFAQSPQAFKYQAAVRNSSGEILQNQIVGLRISIHDATAGGTIVYQETFINTTNDFGLVNLEIGTGAPTIGTFEGIDWGSDSKFLETEFYDGGSYVSMGTSQLLSVPYAILSERSWNAPWERTGNEIFYTGGNVGIGTDNPGGLLDVRGSNLDDGVVFNLGNSDLSHKLTFFGGKETDPNPFIQWKNGDPLRFSTDEGGWSEKMRITSDGKLGIGTTSPIYDLEVTDTTTNGFSDLGLTAKDAHGGFAVYPSTMAAPFDHFADRASLFSNAFTASGLDLRADGISSDIRFYTGGPFAENERMRIDSSGNVGIGISDPTYKLEVYGTTKLKNLRVENGINTALTVINSWVNGVDVMYSGNHALYIYDTGGKGVLVYSSDDDGVFTNSVNGWGFYTHDQTYSNGGYYPVKSGSFAKNIGSDILEPGDLVCISGGYEENVLGENGVPVVNIISANGINSYSIFGVVESRVYIREKKEEIKEGETVVLKSFRFSDETIMPGDYLAVIVLGISNVKVDPSQTIKSGESLTVGEGIARKVQTRKIEGITVAENTGIIGKALEDSNGKDKIKVFVNCK